DIDELWQRSCLRDGFGRRNERVRNRYHRVARFHAGGHQRETESVRTAVHCNCAFRVAERGKLFFEILDHGATDEARGAQCLLENGRELLFELNMWGDKIKKRNAGNAHLVTSVVCSIYRRNRAGLPATMALAGTPFVTTLPAPTKAFSPIVMFARMVQPEPIEAPFFTRVLSTFQSDSVCRPPSAVVDRG